MVAVGVALAIAGLPVPAFTLVVSGGALLLLERVEVCVDEHGLVARTRWGWPRVHFPLEDIEAVTALDVRPSRWGGWGYRGSVRLVRRAAWVLHRGPGIRLELTRSREFVVAVDDAEAGAAALDGLLTRPR